MQDCKKKLPVLDSTLPYKMKNLAPKVSKSQVKIRDYLNIRANICELYLPLDF